MKTSYIKQMNVSDRNNSLKGYFSWLKEKYEKISKASSSIQDKISSGGYDRISDILSLANIMSRLDIKSPEGSSRVGSYDHDEFNALKFKLAKNLNFVQSVLFRICHDSIDSSILGEESDIEDVKQAVIWHYIDCIDVTDPVYQDEERIKNACADIQDFSLNKFTSPDEKRKFIDTFKKCLRAMIGETFDVLGNLINFSQYLAVAEEMSAYTSQKDGDSISEFRKKPSMEKILVLAEIVKEVVLKYLVSYVKVQKLNLPHSFMRKAQFSNSILNDGNFMSSELTGANCHRAVMRGCDFSMCAFDGVNAGYADLTGTTLNYSNLSGTDFSHAVLNDASLSDTNFYDKRIRYKKSYDSIVGTGENVDDEVRDKINKFQRIPKQGVDLRNVISKSKEDGIKALTQDGHPKSLRDGIESFACIKEEIRKYSEKIDAACPHPKCVKALVDSEKAKGKDVRIATLTNASVKRAILPNVDLSFMGMKHSSFDDSDISGSNFYYDSAEASCWSNANISGCRVVHCDLHEATFVNSNASKALFIDSNLTATSFEKAILIGTIFINLEKLSSGEHYAVELMSETETGDSKDKVISARIGGQLNGDDILATRTTEDWGNSSSAHSDMRDCKFQHCIAADSLFLGLNMDRSVFSFADIKKAYVYNCLLRWVDMYRANISYSSFWCNVVHHSALNNLIASNAALCASIFAETNLSGANFISSKMNTVVFDNCDLSGANLANAFFENCVFRNINFQNVNLTQTTFKNCIFDNTNIAKALHLELIKVDNVEILDETAWSDLEQLPIFNDYFTRDNHKLVRK